MSPIILHNQKNYNQAQNLGRLQQIYFLMCGKDYLPTKNNCHHLLDEILGIFVNSSSFRKKIILTKQRRIFHKRKYSLENIYFDYVKWRCYTEKISNQMVSETV